MRCRVAVKGDRVASDGLGKVAGEAKAKIDLVVNNRELTELGKAAELVRTGAIETLPYHAFPNERWPQVRTNSAVVAIHRPGCFSLDRGLIDIARDRPPHPIDPSTAVNQRQRCSTGC